jgi:hypothetical protein
MDRRNRYRAAAVAAPLVAVVLAGPAAADDTRSLLGPGAVTSLSGQRGEEIIFSISVEPGTHELIITTSGGHGDLDLYLSLGDRPSPKDFLHCPTGRNTHERIVVQNPRAGTWQLLVHAFSRFGGASLEIDATRRPEPWAKILSPTGGDSWQMGGEYAVTWRAGPRLRNVRVQLSLDDGRTWLGGALSATVPPEGGHVWLRLPDHRHGTYEARVRIIDAHSGVLLDVSDRFHIAGRPVVIRQPRVIIVLPRLRAFPRHRRLRHLPHRRVGPSRRTRRPTVIAVPRPRMRADRRDSRDRHAAGRRSRRERSGSVRGGGPSRRGRAARRRGR